MVNVKDKIFSQKIELKKYINEIDNRKIEILENICLNKDKVNLKLELDYRNGIHKNYEKDLNDINEILYYINDELIGYLGISCFSGNTAEINGMVHPKFRRRGIFTKLTDMAIEECKKRNFDETLLLCDDKSYSAIKFISNKNGVYSFSECRMKCANWSLREGNKNISLVKAKNEDIDEINKLNNIFFGRIGYESMMPEDEEKNNHITYLIKLYNEVIGKIKISKDSNSAFISGFGIVPEFRGNGYGKEALIETLNNLNKDKIYDVELDVEIKNKKALNLYKYCGFKEQSIMNYYNINI